MILVVNGDLDLHFQSQMIRQFFLVAGHSAIIVVEI